MFPLEHRPHASEGEVCCGQGKTDTELSNIRQHLVVPRADRAQIRVQPLAVIEHLDVIDDVNSHFLSGHLMAQIGAFAFQTAKGALGHGMV
jgi:hypothetical protein